MANPFGSADETLSKNSGHTNAANLVRACIPRSSSKWVEVIGDVPKTSLANGAYDADGYFYGTGTTREEVSWTISPVLNAGGNATLIVGLIHIATTGTQTNGMGFVDIDNSTGAQLRFIFDPYSRRIAAAHVDANSGTTGINNAYLDPGAVAFGAAIRTTAGDQRAFIRIDGSDTNIGTSTNSPTGAANCEYLQINYRNNWKIQYMFVYDTNLSDTDIRSIIDNPGAVLTYTAASSSKRIMTLGVG